MNEQRQQAYFNLIQSLLNCRSDDEIREILAANQDLIDAGFLQTVEAVADMFSQQGDENTANWLQRLLAYFQFLMQVLQATAESRGNAQVVYPLLANNTDKLDGVLAEILRQWGTNTLGEAQADEAESIAADIFLFSDLIQQFPLGNKASNMEIAITGYKVALTVYTSEAFSQKWATIQNCLGLDYRERILGEKAENIELAIAAFSDALSVYTSEAFPHDWATTQNCLGAVYADRIKGEKAENIELAIAAFCAALSVHTQQDFPLEWATTQYNLGNAYCERILGEKAENIELASATYSAALSVYTEQAFPPTMGMGNDTK